MNNRKLLPFLFLVFFGVSVYAQTLSGIYKNDGHATGSYYTVVNWQISYGFEEDGGSVYIKFYNPKITVPTYSKYNFYGQIYSLSDISLSSWPQQNQLPYAMQVSVNVSDGYKNYDVASSCNGDGSCSRVFIASKNNIKNYSIGNMKIPSGASGFHINLGGEPKTEELLKNKKATDKSPQDNKTSNSSAPGSVATSQGVQTYTPSTTEKEIRNQLINSTAVIAGDLIGQWNASIERKRTKELALYEEKRSAEAGERLRKMRLDFIEKYLPLIDKAEKGDDDARMTLYYTSKLFFCKDLVPKRDEWFKTALKNNNADALMETAYFLASDLSDSRRYFERGINLGSVDAMVAMANLFTFPVLDEERFLHYLKMAADLGSPSAMFRLGIVFRYGKYANFKGVPKLKVAINEKIALEWFMKSYQPAYEESIFAKARSNNTNIRFSCYDWLSGYEIEKIIYKDQKRKKVVAGYEDIAKQYEELKSKYAHLKDDHQKFYDSSRYR